MVTRRRGGRRCGADRRLPARPRAARARRTRAARRGRRRSPRRSSCSTTPAAARTATTVEVVVGDGARLRYVVASTTGTTTPSTSPGSAFRLGRDARLTRLQRHPRRRPGPGLHRRATYDGPGGDAELLGVFFADAGQHLEHRLFVDHEAPHCRSDVAYKGALQGEGAHSVWIGDVLIRAEAVGTDTYELNRNLLLTDGARADSVPNLEIETGEIVGAGHASATGRFDDEQLFYLQSRGIPEDEARRLVVRGFFADVVGQTRRRRRSRSGSSPPSRPSWPAPRASAA